MPWLEPITLRSASVTLAPLELRHCDDLIVAVADGELFKLWYTLVPPPAALRSLIEQRLEQQAAGAMLAFAALDSATGQAVGMTNYMNIDAVSRRLEIGGTWYRQRVQRTSFNTQAKLLLLTHAFETLNCIAVEFRTHFFNHQSRRAIERLGAKLDGILRSHQVAANGTLRDTCIYSIIASEWPAVRAHLNWQLEKSREQM